METVKSARWEYSTCPVYGWGDVMSKQKATAGWLAAFPVFEPHWQICMAGGLSTGIVFIQFICDSDLAIFFSASCWISVSSSSFNVQTNQFGIVHTDVKA